MQEVSNWNHQPTVVAWESGLDCAIPGRRVRVRVRVRDRVRVRVRVRVRDRVRVRVMVRVRVRVGVMEFESRTPHLPAVRQRVQRVA